MDIFENSAQLLMSAGIFIAALDIIVFGFATLFLTLIGLAMLLTGVLIYMGILVDDITYILVSVTAWSAIFAVLLWKPLKRLQANSIAKSVGTDLTGMSFFLESDVKPGLTGTYHYSGIDWKVQSADSLAKGTEVEVTELQVGVMTVKRKESE